MSTLIKENILHRERSGTSSNLQKRISFVISELGNNESRKKTYTFLLVCLARDKSP